MLSLHPLATSVQADRERLIHRQAPAPAGRPAALVHPARPHVGELLVPAPRAGLPAGNRA